MLILPPILAEVLTNSTPIYIFINPGVFLFLFLFYSLPVLAIRETAVRRNLGAGGIFILGLAYGIFNEGIVAKTISDCSGLPVPTFDNFGCFSGINFAWMAVIAVWHALHSVLFPIAIVHFLFPEHKDKTWLNKKALILIAAAAFLTGTVFFFQNIGKPAGRIGEYIFFLSLIVLLFAAVFFAPNKKIEQISLRVKSVASGFLLFVLFLFFFIFAGFKPDMILYFSVLVFCAAVYALRNNRLFNSPNLALAALGSYAGFALFFIIVMLFKHRFPEVASGIVFLAVFSYIFAVFKNKASKINATAEKQSKRVDLSEKIL